jgi:probable rRNA maturation factor
MKPPPGHRGLPPSLRFALSLANEQTFIALHRRRIRDALRITLEDERVLSCELSVAVVTDPRIHEINRQFLDHNEPTDVITFELSPPERVPGVPLRPAGRPVRRGAAKRIEGEIVVSAEMAVRRAPEFGWTPHQELTLYLVHGLLHLCGYDDTSATEIQWMRRREAEILALLGLQPRVARSR